MRITIEMSEAENRSTVIRRESGATTDGASAADEASDGGPPPETLLLALGSDGAAGEAGPGEEQGTEAGGPADWLVDVIEGGASR